MKLLESSSYRLQKSTYDVFQSKIDVYLSYVERPNRKVQEICAFDEESVAAIMIDENRNRLPNVKINWEPDTIYIIEDSYCGYFYGIRKVPETTGQWILYYEFLPPENLKKSQYRLVMQSCYVKTYQELLDRIEELNVLRMNDFTEDMFSPSKVNATFAIIASCSAYVAGWWIDTFKYGLNNGRMNMFWTPLIGLILSIILIIGSLIFINGGYRNIITITKERQFSDKIRLEALRRHYESIIASFIGCEIIYILGSVVIDFMSIMMQWGIHDINLVHKIGTPIAIMITAIVYMTKLSQVMNEIGFAAICKNKEGGADDDGSEHSVK